MARYFFCSAFYVSLILFVVAGDCFSQQKQQPVRNNSANSQQVPAHQQQNVIVLCCVPLYDQQQNSQASLNRLVPQSVAYALVDQHGNFALPASVAIAQGNLVVIVPPSVRSSVSRRLAFTGQD